MSSTRLPNFDLERDSIDKSRGLKQTSHQIEATARESIENFNKSALELLCASGPVRVGLSRDFDPITQPHERGLGGAETGKQFTQIPFQIFHINM